MPTIPVEIRPDEFVDFEIEVDTPTFIEMQQIQKFLSLNDVGLPHSETAAQAFPSHLTSEVHGYHGKS